MKDKDSFLEALGLLREMRAVDREKGLKRFLDHIADNPLKRRRDFWFFIRNAAAVVIPFLLILNVWLLIRPEKKERPTERSHRRMEVVAMNGTKVLYTLPDSSQVWLRGGSKMVYDADMTTACERRVEIAGEAYFDVHPDKEKPFYVSLSDVDVKVTGTEFNCSTDYHGQIQVTLAEGHVDMIRTKDGQRHVLTSLTPGEHFDYNRRDHSFEVQDVDVRKHIGWKDGYLLFDNDLMSDVAERISHWYGVEIVLADKRIRDIRFTACFEDLKLGQIIDILELSSNLTSTYLPGKVDKEGKATPDKLILRLN